MFYQEKRRLQGDITAPSSKGPTRELEMDYWQECGVIGQRAKASNVAKARFRLDVRKKF